MAKNALDQLQKERVYAYPAGQFHPHGGQLDFVWLPARTMRHTPMSALGTCGACPPNEIKKHPDPIVLLLLVASRQFLSDAAVEEGVTEEQKEELLNQIEQFKASSNDKDVGGSERVGVASFLISVAHLRVLEAHVGRT